VIYPLAAAFLAGAVIAGAGAWRVQSWRHDAAELAALEQARETEVMRRKAANAGATQHEREKIVIREKFVPIREEVERVVIQYRDSVCLADDGLRVLQGAISRANGDPGEPRNSVFTGPATP